MSLASGMPPLLMALLLTAEVAAQSTVAEPVCRLDRRPAEARSQVVRLITEAHNLPVAGRPISMSVDSGTVDLTVWLMPVADMTHATALALSTDGCLWTAGHGWPLDELMDVGVAVRRWNSVARSARLEANDSTAALQLASLFWSFAARQVLATSGLTVTDESGLSYPRFSGQASRQGAEEWLVQITYPYSCVRLELSRRAIVKGVTVTPR